MKKTLSLISLSLIMSCAFASNDLSLIPTQTNGFERNFNPFDPTIGSFYATDFVYEPLWIFNVWHPENDYPRLAESVEIAPDYKSVTYRLREGVRWSDGERFDADDVIFTVRYARQYPDFPINIDLFDPATDSGLVNDVEKLDDYTVRFTLVQSNALAHQSIGGLYPLPEHIFSQVDDPINYPNLNPIGTGPFTEVDAFSTTSFKLCQNPEYYQADRVQIDCLRFPLYSGNERLWAAARRGKIDWMGQGINQPGEQYTDHLPSNKVWLAPGANTNVQINTTRPPLSDVRFRQALSMALNRDKMLREDTFGLTSPTPWPVATGPGYTAWYDAQVLQPFARLMQYNPGEAAALLDQAGYRDTNTNGWREMPDGTEINIGIAVPSGWTDWFNVVLTMVENFRAVGINATIEGMDEQKWFERIPTGDFDLYMMWTNPGITPWKIYSELFNPKSMTPGQLENQAMHQYRSEDIERWLQAFTQTGDPVEQRQLISQIQTVVAEQVPVLSLFANPIWYEYNDQEFVGWVTEANPFVRPQVHKGVPERLIHVLNLKPRE